MRCEERAGSAARQGRDGAIRELAVRDVVLFQFVVIGEAVKNLAPETRDSEPEVPWADVAGLRDLIAHEYFRIEIDRVIAIVERDLPQLEQAIDRLLGE